MKQWDAMVDGHVRRCETVNLSQATLYGRRRELERFGLWLKRRRPRIDLADVTGEIILEYVSKRTKFISKTSVNSVMSHLRCFGEFLVEQGEWKENPLRWQRGPKVDHRRIIPRRISRDHLKKILEEAAGTHRKYYRHLWLSLLTVLYGTGLRRGELSRLNVNDYERETGCLRIDGRKTGTERRVPLPASTVQFLEVYLPHRQNVLLRCDRPSESALFVSEAGLRMQGDRIGIALHRLSRRAKVPLVTLHQFRHSAACDMLQEGVGIPEIQRILGHSWAVSTMRYAQVADPDRIQAIAMHPINEILRMQLETPCLS